MPFGLKNVGATYQRLMEKVFKYQIGRNLEVYVDDIVIKIQNDNALLKYTEEMLETIKKVHVKLNPTKCMFGVQEGKIIGILSNKKGNPTKYGKGCC